MARGANGIKQVRLKVPAGPEELAALEIGTVVFLDGVIYTGRESVYKKVVGDGHPLPADLAAITNVNFHCSPAAAPDGQGGFRVGAVTATASFRFSQWMRRWFEISGARMIIGKGGMSARDYRELFQPLGAVYLTTLGYGTGALLGRGIKRVRDVFWLDELGIAQAMWVLEVENFGPLLVDGDAHGHSLFERQQAEINPRLAKLYEGLKPPALHRYGETDDRKDELI
ncbi:MAG: fumarate hydratase C-terminal domain-containing protein [Geminicoccaceae bacterium]|nr:fumarate hydratase C-terminal domain-containing protein [Geminicoccaceae bacterium]MCB9942158.1 fumarate hydratase C-terminal domain-containing protein [Geminicoccaceae bacterium]